MPRLESLVAWISQRIAMIAVSFLLCVTAYVLARDPGRVGIAHHIEITDSAPDVEKAFVMRLSEVDAAAIDPGLQMRLMECVQSTPTSPLQRYLAWSYVFQYFDEALPKRFPELTIELCRKIGTGIRTLQRVRNRGEGAFFSEQASLYFSTSDNSDPRFNGRRYRLDVSVPAPRAFTGFTVVLAAFLGIGLAAHVAVLATRNYVRLFRSSAVFRNVAPGILILAVLICFIYLAAEIYLRCTIPFIGSTWPSHFDPRVGFIFDPGATVRWTNGSDFWTETKVNSLGFLDREPRIPKPDDTFRILVIGDSFVEAAQVEIEQKFHVLLETILNERLPTGRRIDTVAAGYSGTGQVNQISFYDAFGPRLHPDLVILLFVFNDFPNNSSLLEAVRNGWSPTSPPRLFFSHDADGSYRRIGLDADWQQFVDPVPRNQPNERLIASRVEYLRSQPEFHGALGDWNPPDDLDLDDMFYATDMPPAFNDALAATAEAFRVFAEYAKRDGFQLLVVATPHDGPSSHPNRHVIPFLARTRLREIVEAEGIAFFDLSPGFKKRSDPREATFKLDSHWSPKGHEWAAEEIGEFLIQHLELTRRNGASPMP